MRKQSSASGPTQAVIALPPGAPALLPCVSFTPYPMSFAHGIAVQSVSPAHGIAVQPVSPAHGIAAQPRWLQEPVRFCCPEQQPSSSKGATTAPGGVSDPSCPWRHHLRSLNPTYLQHSGVIQSGRESGFAILGGWVTACPASSSSSVPPPASPGQVQGLGSHPDLTTAPHSQATHCGHQRGAAKLPRPQRAPRTPQGMLLSSVAAG